VQPPTSEMIGRVIETLRAAWMSTIELMTKVAKEFEAFNEPIERRRKTYPRKTAYFKSMPKYSCNYHRCVRAYARSGLRQRDRKRNGSEVI
jgi:hypothetical protein